MQDLVRRPPNEELRASAGRIVNMLQQLVIDRPETIIPLEEIVKEILASPRVQTEKRRRPCVDGTHSPGRSPLPPKPVPELSALQALPETPLPPAAAKVRRKRALRSGESRSRARDAKDGRRELG